MSSKEKEEIENLSRMLENICKYENEAIVRSVPGLKTWWAKRQAKQQPVGKWEEMS